MRPASPPEPPRYGEASLADLSASLLAAAGVPGLANPLGLPPADRTCLLVIDGLGWELLRANPERAPFLSLLVAAGRPLTAGFPATTATSLTSLGTAEPPGGHGMFGYQVAVPGTRRLLNCLRWDRRVDPRAWQSAPTVFERAAAAGVLPSYVSAGAYERSGLSVATARGSTYVAADSLGALTARAAEALRAAPRTYVQVYHSDLDTTGHRRGVGSDDWAMHLEFVDMLAERLAARLPGGARLYITADHGMVDVTERVAVDADPVFTEGVRLLGGEPRARHVYARKGAAGDVLAAWREGLAGCAWVRSRAEAIAAGWFGEVRAELRGRIGDVVAVPWGRTGLVAPGPEKIESMLIGMHGSLIPEEQLVPLLVAGSD